MNAIKTSDLLSVELKTLTNSELADLFNKLNAAPELPADQRSPKDIVKFRTVDDGIKSVKKIKQLIQKAMKTMEKDKQTDITTRIPRAERSFAPSVAGATMPDKTPEQREEEKANKAAIKEANRVAQIKAQVEQNKAAQAAKEAKAAEKEAAKATKAQELENTKAAKAASKAAKTAGKDAEKAKKAEEKAAAKALKDAEKAAKKAAGAHRRKGTNLLPPGFAPTPCRVDSNQAIMVDMLSRAEGVTIAELGAGVPHRTTGVHKSEASCRGAFGWDMKLHGYGVRSVLKEGEPERFFLVVPVGFSIPSHTEKVAKKASPDKEAKKAAREAAKAEKAATKEAAKALKEAAKAAKAEAAAAASLARLNAAKAVAEAKVAAAQNAAPASS